MTEDDEQRNTPEEGEDYEMTAAERDYEAYRNSRIHTQHEGESEEAYRQRDREESAEEYRLLLTAVGNLDPDEVDRLVNYELLTGPKSVKEQVDKYYLKYKDHAPAHAAELAGALATFGEIPNDDQIDEALVQRLCIILNEYHHYVRIDFNGKPFYGPGSSPEAQDARRLRRREGDG